MSYPKIKFKCNCIYDRADLSPSTIDKGKAKRRVMTCPDHPGQFGIKKILQCSICGSAYEAHMRHNGSRCPSCAKKETRRLQELYRRKRGILEKVKKIMPLEPVLSKNVIQFSNLSNPNLSPCVQGCNVWDRGEGPNQPECRNCDARVAYDLSTSSDYVFSSGEMGGDSMGFRRMAGAKS